MPEQGRYSFRISDHDQVINLLVSELYAGDPDVSIREVIQNARDANHAFRNLPDGEIVRRELNRNVSIGIWQRGDSICISDTGIGMSADDIQKFFLDIGITEKSARTNFSPAVQSKISTDGYIGKYGVGVLGYFIFAKEIELYTKRYDQVGGGNNSWLKLTASIDQRKSVELTTVSYEELQIVLPKTHPFMNSDHPDRLHGTIVMLKARDPFDSPMVDDPKSAGRNFYTRISELKKKAELQRLVTKYCFFLDQEIIYYKNYGSEKWVDNERELEERGLNEVFEDLEGEENINSLLKSFYKRINIGDNKTGDLIIFLRDNTTYGHKGIDIYVDGMLVEASSKDILPFWTNFMHGVLSIKGVSTSLDRRALNKRSNQYEKLKTELENAFIELFKKFITEDENTFKERLWNALDGNFLPKLVQAYNGYYGPKAKAETIKLLKAVALNLPIPMVRKRRVKRGNKPYVDFSETIYSVIYDGIKSNKISISDENKSLTLYYIKELGSIEVILDRAQMPIINASEQERHKWVKPYLEIISELELSYESLKINFEVFDFSSKFEEKQPESKGWNLLVEVFMKMMNYGESESYKVKLIDYEPVAIPAVISEKEINVQAYNAVIDHLKNQGNDTFEEIIKLIEQTKRREREWYIYLNISNPILNALADFLENFGETSLIRMIVSEIAENARIDHYGGKFIGTDALVAIYESVRTPRMKKSIQDEKNLYKLRNECLPNLEQMKQNESLPNNIKELIEANIKLLQSVLD